MISIYGVLDTWYGERLNSSVAARSKDLPLDQAVSLYEHIKEHSYSSLNTDEVPGSLRPLINPWLIDRFEVQALIGAAQTSVALLTGETGMFGIGESGAFRLPDGGQAAGLGIRARADWTRAFTDQVNTICRMALYAHRVRMPVWPLLPTPPKDSDLWDTWLADVKFRLMLLATLRPLYDIGVLEVGAPVRRQEFVSAQEILNSLRSLKTALGSDIQDAYLEIEVSGGPKNAVGVDQFVKRLIGNGITVHRAAWQLQQRSDLGGNLFPRTRSERAALEATLHEAVAPRDEDLLQSLLTVPVPEPQLLIPAEIARLRAQEDAFENWRMALTHALQSVLDIVPSDQWQTESRTRLTEQLSPEVQRLQRMTKHGRFGSMFVDSIRNFIIGGVLFAGATTAAHGGAFLPGLAGGGATAVSGAAYDYLRGRSDVRRGKAMLDVFTTFGLSDHLR
jgi:hypothetical protein